MSGLDIAAGVPICGFVGPNGVGKTLLAVASAISAMKAGRPVYSTVPIDSKYGASLPIRSLRELLELRDCTVLLDEVAVVFSSRSSTSLPPEADSFLQVLRHRGIDLMWTAPDWMRADNRLRSVTQAVVIVNTVLRRRSRSNPWPTPRLGVAALMDTSTGKVDAQPDRRLRTRFFVPRRLESFGAYDTHADTPVLGHRDLSGICPDCGGSRTRPKHSEERHRELGLPWYDEDELLAASRRGVAVNDPDADTVIDEEGPAQGGAS